MTSDQLRELAKTSLNAHEFVWLWNIERHGLVSPIDLNILAAKPLLGKGLVAFIEGEYCTTIKGHEWLRMTGVLARPIEA